ncbi:MAG: restriction endonuclease subunit S [Helicobacter sp.]|nr:restriction endonuclease subunit S [Helicobacter sp.]
MTSSCHSEGDKPEESHIADSHRDISHFSNAQYDKENNLPQGWEVKTLGEIFLIERGGSPRPIKEYLTTDSDGINWIKIGDTKNITKYITETAQKIKPEGKKHSRFVEIGDLILSNSMSFGKPYIMKTTGCIHDGWVVFKQSKKVIDEEFCYYVLSSSEIYAQFDKLATGSTVKNLNIERIKQIQIPLPPLETQKQIVEILDSKFAALENLERETNASLEKLQRLKSLLLNLAFKGELIC